MKKSYEKIILAVCALAGLGVAYLGYSKVTAVDEDFVLDTSGAGKNEVAIVGADQLKSTLESLAKPINLAPKESGESKRPIDSFVGVALFAKKPQGEEVAKPVDPYLDAPIHPPIPNQWWLDNKIDPGFGDSPQRDEDKDGYSNLEEFEAKTSPIDSKAYPALINKLQYAKYESAGYFLWFSSALGPEKYQFKIVPLPPQFEAAAPAEKEAYLGSSGLKYNRTKDYLGRGANIFTEGFGKDRFKLKSVEQKDVTNEATKLTEKKEFATIEDLVQRNEFDIPKTPNTRQRPGTVRYDRTAVLILNAVGAEGVEFKVPENTAFGLPSDSPKKDYLLKTVTANSIVVEYKDAEGKTQTIEIKKN